MRRRTGRSDFIRWEIGWTCVRTRQGQSIRRWLSTGQLASCGPTPPSSQPAPFHGDGDAVEGAFSGVDPDPGDKAVFAVSEPSRQDRLQVVRRDEDGRRRRTQTPTHGSRQEPCDREREEAVAEADGLRSVVGQDRGDAPGSTVEDVATPFYAGAVSRCAPRGCAGPHPGIAKRALPAMAQDVWRPPRRGRRRWCQCLVLLRRRRCSR
jgi:hypothetical protein